ncbi:embigin-like, partial [Carlito syrichta]|uniref:Embigin-like n=1 Tax=Carlito syrichta TaxID=1868482 RepID=A0A1U7UB57_CARSF
MIMPLHSSLDGDSNVGREGGGEEEEKESERASGRRECARRLRAPTAPSGRRSLHEDRGGPSRDMRALPGPRGPRAPTSGPLLLLCLLAAARRSSADGDAPDSPFTSLPVRKEMMAKYSNLSLESHNISLTEHSSMPVEKNITLERPSNIKLTCQFTTSGDLNSVNVTWKKDDGLLENNYLVNVSGSILYTQYRSTIINSKQMGSYSCFFQEEKEQRGTFNFK